MDTSVKGTASRYVYDVTHLLTWLPPQQFTQMGGAFTQIGYLSTRQGAWGA